MKPQKLQLKVRNVQMLNQKVIKVDFQVDVPKDFTFEPGQHISIKTDDKNARPYSIYSDYINPELISIIVSVGHSGVGADFLKKLNKWDKVEALGPLGKFRFPESPKENILMFASGTGIVPIITMLNNLKNTNPKIHITLYFGVKDEESMFLKENTDVLEDYLTDFDCEIVYSQPKIHTGAHEGHVQDYLKINDLENTQVVACGHSEMVSDIKKIAEEAGLKDEDIFTS